MTTFLRPRSTRALACGFVLALSALLGLNGCTTLATNPPATVASVDLDRYVGVWYEIASYPTFFNQGLTGVTATYGTLPDGRVSVFNRGFKDALDGPETTIRGKARVVDTTTKSKLAVRFDQFPVSLFEGQYWIVLLDPNYAYAAVSDPQRSTLFILSRTPQLDAGTYTSILNDLAANGFDTTKLHLTPQAAS